MLVEFDDVISERQSFDELRVAAPTLDLFVPSNVDSVVQSRDATSSTFAGRFGDFGTTTLVNPSSSLRFDLGVGSQSLRLEGLGTDFDADLFIDGDATDFVQIGDEGTGFSVADSRFEVTAGAIEVAGPVSATGDGSVQLTASEWVAVTATGSIVTEDGSVVLSGGVPTVSNPGSQPGVTVDGGTIFTRNGAIQLTGFGGAGMFQGGGRDERASQDHRRSCCIVIRYRTRHRRRCREWHQWNRSCRDADRSAH